MYSLSTTKQQLVLSWKDSETQSSSTWPVNTKIFFETFLVQLSKYIFNLGFMYTFHLLSNFNVENLMTDACIFRARQSSLQELHDQHGMEMGTNFIEAKSRFTPVSLINQMPIKYVDCPRPSSTSSKLFVIFEFKSQSSGSLHCKRSFAA